MRRAAFLAALLGAILAAAPMNASLGSDPEVPSVAEALAITAHVEAETVLDLARDGTIVRVRSNANPPDYTSTILCVYTYSSAPCSVTSELLEQLASLPLRRQAAYGTVYP